MENFLQQMINGLSVGGIYALMAVGYSLVYSIMNFSNFAHGGVIMFGAYFGFYFMTLGKLSFPLSFALAGLASAALAILVERVAYKPLTNRKAPFLYYIISAMGVSIFLENIVIATIGPTFRTYPDVFSIHPISIGPLELGRIDLLMFLVSLVCLGFLIYMLDFTKLGKAIRATSYNMKASALMGINTEIIILVIFAVGGLFAGFAGVLFGMKYTVYPQIGMITMKSFIAAVFGGLGSVPGAVIGSVLLGIIETITAGYLSSQYRDLIAYALLVLVLVVRPMGLMGKSTEDKA